MLPFATELLPELDSRVRSLHTQAFVGEAMLAALKHPLFIRSEGKMLSVQYSCPWWNPLEPGHNRLHNMFPAFSRETIKLSVAGPPTHIPHSFMKHRLYKARYSL